MLCSGLLGSVYRLIRGYILFDITASTFYWVSFRYRVAVFLGVAVPMVLKNDMAGITAFLLAIIAPRESIDRFSGKIHGPHSRAEMSHLLQGIGTSTAERREELGIATIQELAYSDPLALLFRSTFPPKVVLHWIDQALAASYVGAAIKDLRVRGVRGAIELSQAFKD